jgi:hypothetical protein
MRGWTAITTQTFYPNITTLSNAFQTPFMTVLVPLFNFTQSPKDKETHHYFILPSFPSLSFINQGVPLMPAVEQA